MSRPAVLPAVAVRWALTGAPIADGPWLHARAIWRRTRDPAPSALAPALASAVSTGCAAKPRSAAALPPRLPPPARA